MADIGSSGTGTPRFPYYYGPEGRLLLVDSALEAVGRGSTTIGIKTSTFALISSHIKPTRPLVEPSEKIFAIDRHVGATGSGYIGDILQLIDEMRITAQKHRLIYDSPVDIKSLARQLSSYLHDFTIYAVRPQAASIIIAGLDPAGVQLYQVDPSGTYFSGSGFAIGQYSETAIDVIQKEYTEDITLDQAVQLSDRAIEKALGETPSVGRGLVTAKLARFQKMADSGFHLPSYSQY
jgi:proteasome alpha subunit